MAAATNSVTGGFWTSGVGEGRNAGNSHGSSVTKVCPDGAVVNKIRGGSEGAIDRLGFSCSDGTDIGQYGGGGGNPFSGTCDSGYAPAAIDGGWYLDAIKFICPSNSANNITRNNPGNPVTCPTGYAMTGYRGEAGDVVGSIAVQCAPSSSDTKIACCMGIGGDNCREYNPQSGICDSFMRARAKLEPNRGEFACLAAGDTPLPQCTDVKCQQFGYKLATMKPSSCPTSLTLYDCKQIMTLKDAKTSSIADNSLTQQCGPLLAKNSTHLTPVPVPLPVPGGSSGSRIPPPPPAAKVGSGPNKTVYIGCGILVIIIVIGITFALLDDNSSQYPSPMPQYAPHVPMSY
jgi:hypothetical protein